MINLLSVSKKLKKDTAIPEEPLPEIYFHYKGNLSV